MRFEKGILRERKSLKPNHSLLNIGERMTLTVTIRVPDGIVIAADSLASLFQILTPQGEVKCPKCDENIKLPDLTIPPINMPAGGSPYAQKLFNIGKRNVGIAVYGTPFLDGRTIESHIREFEKTKIVGEETVEEVANKLKDFFHRYIFLRSFQ